MYYGNIKKNDIANGKGVRVTLFVSGCTNHCKNCFQPETWNFDYGKPYTKATEDEVIEALKPGHIAGLTLLGGEPFEPENQRELVKLLRRVRKELPEKNIWSFTGFILDQDLLDGGRKHCEVTDEMLSLLDVLVDGPFKEEEKDLMLLALILHDGLKSGLEKSQYTLIDHPLLMANYIKDNKEKLTLTPGEIDFLANVISSHMGPWTKDYKGNEVLNQLINIKNSFICVII